MSLDSYVENAWLKKEPTSSQEIADQLGIVVRCMKDAGVEGISDDLPSIQLSTPCSRLPIPRYVPADIALRINRAITCGRLRRWNTPSEWIARQFANSGFLQKAQHRKLRLGRKRLE
jgi:hypothetical protein